MIYITCQEITKEGNTNLSSLRKILLQSFDSSTKSNTQKLELQLYSFFTLCSEFSLWVLFSLSLIYKLLLLFIGKLKLLLRESTFLTLMVVITIYLKLKFRKLIRLDNIAESWTIHSCQDDWQRLDYYRLWQSRLTSGMTSGSNYFFQESRWQILSIFNVHILTEMADPLHP